MHAMHDQLREDVKERLRDIQHDVLVAVASGQPLADIMGELCRAVEAVAPEVICSILTVDRQGRLHPLAAPSLPTFFCKAIDGIPIGPVVGSCGTAAYRGEPVEVHDIANDPLWAGFKDLALSIDLRACWSSPIRNRLNRVVGTFAFYYRTPRAPSALEKLAVMSCVHLCAIAIDHEEAREEIHQLAFYDAVTGLPNRARFQQKASARLADPQPGHEQTAVHYLDLDDFKGVNDTLGHDVGDELLRAVAVRLKACTGEHDVVARLGGDEFAILQQSSGVNDAPEKLAQTIIEAFRDPFDLSVGLVSAGVSIGYASADENTASLATLMKHADLALYRAKAEGGGAARCYSTDLSVTAITRRTLENDLRRALAQGELSLHYQPCVNLKTQTIIGAEALLRWTHPTRGFVPPSDFIPIAEQCGLISEIGDWVLATACADAAAWPEPINVAVNVSPLQLRRPGFCLDVARVLSAAGLMPQRLEIEITETALLVDGPTMRLVLQTLRDAGIAIALDDFGTGYSSLSHIRNYPIGKIKIDQSFVREFGEVRDSTAIVLAVLGLAADLGMTTTAEGIETEEQRSRLRFAGCELAQGYFFGRPQPNAEFRRLLGCHALTLQDQVRRA